MKAALFGVLAVAALVTACTPPPLLGDPRVVLTPDANVLADAPIVVEGALLSVSVRLVNPSNRDRPVIETTDWKDAAGQPIRTLLSAPQRLTVPRYGDAEILAVAPTPNAVQFRIRVEPDYSAIDPS